MIVPQIDKSVLNDEARLNLGRQYVEEIKQIADVRSRRMSDIYAKAVKYYENTTETTDFPWPEASTATIPIIPTHTDAIHARLYNTAVGQDPIWQISEWGSGEVFEGLGIELSQYARALQKFSHMAESEWLPIRQTLEEGLMIMCKYGDVIYYMPWEQDTVSDYDFDPTTGEFEEVEDRVAYNGPRIHVISPEDFYISVDASGHNAIQRAKTIAYRFTLDEDQLRSWIKQDYYDEKTGQELLDILVPSETQDEQQKDRSEDKQWFEGTGDAKPSRLSEQYANDAAGLSPSTRSRTLEMYHVFTRLDLGKNYPSEVNFHVHESSSLVPRIAYNEHAHKKRQFERMNYAIRDGYFYSIGIPEMLFKIQEIMNQVIRDILNNNKVKNTKAFLVRVGSPIKPGLKMYPSRLIFVSSLEGDFMPIDLGSGNVNTSIQDIILMQQWAERRTGISDFNLGQERTGRTPATTTLAMLEEVAKRLDLVIRRMRLSMNSMWKMILQDYMQFADDDTLASMGDEEASRILKDVWERFTPATISKRIIINAQVSTQNLNRSVRRQEALAMFGQAEAYYKQVTALAQALQATQDPTFRRILVHMLRGGQEIMQKFYDSFDQHNQTNLVPDVASMVEEQYGGEVGPVPGVNPGTEVAEIASVLGGPGGPPGPINPPGRPIEGQGRIQAAGPVPPGTIALP